MKRAAGKGASGRENRVMGEVGEFQGKKEGVGKSGILLAITRTGRKKSVSYRKSRCLNQIGQRVGGGAGEGGKSESKGEEAHVQDVLRK